MRQLIVRLLITLAVPIFVASCATNARHDGSIKQCSDTPQKAIAQWFVGVAERDADILRALIPDGASIYEVFSTNGQAEEIIREIVADPISGKHEGCACTPVSTIDDPSDSRIKIVTVKRTVYVDDVRHGYKRAFRVTFDPGNCILDIKRIYPKWERME